MQFIAQWQCEIEDPSVSSFKKSSLEGAVRRYEGWVDAKNLRIKKIEEELWSESVIVEKMGEYFIINEQGLN